MAASNFCYQLMLAAVLVCIIGTIACKHVDKNEMEEKIEEGMKEEMEEKMKEEMEEKMEEGMKEAMEEGMKEGMKEEMEEKMEEEMEEEMKEEMVEGMNEEMDEKMKKKMLKEMKKAGNKLKKRLSKDLRPEQVLKELKGFEWKDFSLGHIRVKGAISYSERNVSRCTEEVFDYMDDVIDLYKEPRLFTCFRHFHWNKKSLIRYLQHYFKEFAQFCLDNLSSVRERVLSSHDIKNLNDFVTFFGEGSQSTDKDPDLKEAVEKYLAGRATDPAEAKKQFEGLKKSCNNYWDQVISFKGSLDYYVSQEFNGNKKEWYPPGWRHLRKACLKVIKSKVLTSVHFTPATSDPNTIIAPIIMGIESSAGGFDGGCSSDCAVSNCAVSCAMSM